MVKVIEQSYEIITDLDGLVILKNIERAARTCYKSENLITTDGQSAMDLCKKLVSRKHWPMLEFGGMITVHIICNRGLSHELVRHRIASFAQESTRYCDYCKDKHGNEITVIRPIVFCNIEDKVEPLRNKRKKQLAVWLESMYVAEKSYFKLREMGIEPQEARGVLPIDLKTEINISANPVEWRHIFKLRISSSAHPQIMRIMSSLLEEFRKKIPILFDDLGYNFSF